MRNSGLRTGTRRQAAVVTTAALCAIMALGLAPQPGHAQQANTTGSTVATPGGGNSVGTPADGTGAGTGATGNTGHHQHEHHCQHRGRECEQPTIPGNGRSGDGRSFKGVHKNR